jgi:REP element-mobilizing transposase RayT
MPPRAPIDPEGVYHVGSRGTYGRTLFATVDQHELFLAMYGRAARKYGWKTLAFALMRNHHHFVVELTDGGLSEGLRELHGGYSRRIHAMNGQTRKGHLFRHGFFANHLLSEQAVVAASSYVDANPLVHRMRPLPRRNDWSSYAATLDLVAPLPFHSPRRLLELVDPDPSRARRRYRLLVEESHARARLDLSPNDGVGSVTAAGVIQSPA